MPVPTPVALWEFIKSTYNMEELETLCFQLGVHFDDLEGETREAKARELVEHLQRTDRLDELTAVLAEERPERYQSVFGDAIGPPPAQTAPTAAGPMSGSDRRVVWVLGGVVLIVLIVWLGSALRGRAGTRPDTSSTTTVGAGIEQMESAATNSPTIAPQTTTLSSDPLNTASNEVESEENPAVGDGATPDIAPALTPSLAAMTVGEVITRTITTPAGTQVEQVFVPAGSFMMGMDMPDIHGPIHQVSLDAFWIDKTEVTNQQYEKCVLASICEPPSNDNSVTRNPYYGIAEYSDFPVIGVNWHQAVAYCEWVGGRLPTEAEWEYAARGPESFIYPWGDEVPSCDRLNYGNGCVGDTSKVGSYPSGASWIGALDMAGNVSEFINDWWDKNYYQTSPEVNPLGPASGEFRVVRGANFGTHISGVNASLRLWERPNYPSSILGFRCVGE